MPPSVCPPRYSHGAPKLNNASLPPSGIAPLILARPDIPRARPSPTTSAIAENRGGGAPATPGRRRGPLVKGAPLAPGPPPRQPGTPLAPGSSCGVTPGSLPRPRGGRGTSLAQGSPGSVAPGSLPLSARGVAPPLPPGTLLAPATPSGVAALWDEARAAASAVVVERVPMLLDTSAAYVEV